MTGKNSHISTAYPNLALTGTLSLVKKLLLLPTAIVKKKKKSTGHIIFAFPNQFVAKTVEGKNTGKNPLFSQIDKFLSFNTV